MGKKSLADQLALLTEPQADFDIEDSHFKDDAFDQDSDALASDSDDDHLRSEHYVQVPKSKLRGNGPISDSKYTGKVATRDDLYASSGSDGQSESEEDGSDVEEDSLSDRRDTRQQRLDVEDDDAADLDGNADHSMEENALNDLDENSTLSSRSGSENDANSDLEDGDDADSDSQAHTRAKVRELMAKERKHVVNRLSQSASVDALKGYAISSQHGFFDKIIEARLKMQKAVTSANLLPATPAQAEPLLSSKSSSLVSRATQECTQLLDSILALRVQLAQRDKAPAKYPAVKKRTFAEYSLAASALDTSLTLYRSAVLQKWLAKVQNSSGALALQSGKFKAINQSFDLQVAHTLTDMDRLIKRTKLNRRQIKPLGSVVPELDTQTAISHAPEIDTIFDDEDFYRVLLNDLVDKKVLASDPTSGIAISLRTAQRAQKIQKNVDTKASKGRKLRFHVQEQIANFDAPKNRPRWNDDQTDEFFASLLGQSVNMNEVEDDDEEDDVELEADGQSIQLFG